MHSCCSSASGRRPRAVEPRLPPRVGRHRSRRARRRGHLPQQLLRVGPGPGRDDRGARLGVQRHAAGPVGPGRGQRRRAHGPGARRRDAPNDAPRLAQRLLLRPRPRHRCPGISARNWQNDAYSPRTGLLYTATSNRCGAMRVVEGEYVPGERYNLRASGGPPQPSSMGGHANDGAARIAVARRRRRSRSTARR